jgi:hypothetical protein
VQLPAPPAFMGACPLPAPAKAGDDVRVKWREADAALANCSRRGAQSRAWYLGVKKRYSESPLR